MKSQAKKVFEKRERFWNLRSWRRWRDYPRQKLKVKSWKDLTNGMQSNIQECHIETHFPLDFDNQQAINNEQYPNIMKIKASNKDSHIQASNHITSSLLCLPMWQMNYSLANSDQSIIHKIKIIIKHKDRVADKSKKILRLVSDEGILHNSSVSECWH